MTARLRARLLAAGQSAAEDRRSGHMSFFGAMAETPDATPEATEIANERPLPSVPAWSKRQTLDAERERAAALRAEQRGSAEQKLSWAAAAAEGLQAELRAELRAAREALAAAESGAARQAQVSNP